MAGVFAMDQMLTVGAWGEQVVWDYFTQKGWPVQDVSNDPTYRTQDIDLLVQAPKGPIGVEVKLDRHGVSNVYIEEVSSLGRGSKGCTLATQADFLFYVFGRLGRALVIPAPALQEWAKTRLRDFPAKSPATVGNRTASRGYPVPERVILAEVPGTFRVLGLPQYKEN